MANPHDDFASVEFLHPNRVIRLPPQYDASRFLDECPVNTQYRVLATLSGYDTAAPSGRSDFTTAGWGGGQEPTQEGLQRFLEDAQRGWYEDGCQSSDGVLLKTQKQLELWKAERQTMSHLATDGENPGSSWYRGVGDLEPSNSSEGIPRVLYSTRVVAFHVSCGSATGEPFGWSDSMERYVVMVEENEQRYHIAYEERERRKRRQAAIQKSILEQQNYEREVEEAKKQQRLKKLREEEETAAALEEERPMYYNEEEGYYYDDRGYYDDEGNYYLFEGVDGEVAAAADAVADDENGSEVEAADAFEDNVESDAAEEQQADRFGWSSPDDGAASSAGAAADESGRGTGDARGATHGMEHAEAHASSDPPRATVEDCTSGDDVDVPLDCKKPKPMIRTPSDEEWRAVAMDGGIVSTERAAEFLHAALPTAFEYLRQREKVLATGTGSVEMAHSHAGPIHCLATQSHLFLVLVPDEDSESGPGSRKRSETTSKAGYGSYSNVQEEIDALLHASNVDGGGVLLVIPLSPSACGDGSGSPMETPYNRFSDRATVRRAMFRRLAANSAADLPSSLVVTLGFFPDAAHGEDTASCDAAGLSVTLVLALTVAKTSAQHEGFTESLELLTPQHAAWMERRVVEHLLRDGVVERPDRSNSSAEAEELRLESLRLVKECRLPLFSFPLATVLHVPGGELGNADDFTYDAAHNRMVHPQRIEMERRLLEELEEKFYHDRGSESPRERYLRERISALVDVEEAQRKQLEAVALAVYASHWKPDGTHSRQLSTVERPCAEATESGCFSFTYHLWLPQLAMFDKQYQRLKRLEQDVWERLMEDELASKLNIERQRTATQLAQQFAFEHRVRLMQLTSALQLLELDEERARQKITQEWLEGQVGQMLLDQFVPLKVSDAMAAQQAQSLSPESARGRSASSQPPSASQGYFSGERCGNKASLPNPFPLSSSVRCGETHLSAPRSSSAGVAGALQIAVACEAPYARPQFKKSKGVRRSSSPAVSQVPPSSSMSMPRHGHMHRSSERGSHPSGPNPGRSPSSVMPDAPSRSLESVMRRTEHSPLATATASLATPKRTSFPTTDCLMRLLSS